MSVSPPVDVHQDEADAGGARVVPGSGSQDSVWAIVGEAPGATEDRAGLPFVGRSGQLLRKTLGRVGLDPNDAYITNVVRVRPPDNKTPTAKEINAARPELAAELAALPNLRAVLLLGNVPLKAVTGQTGVTKHRGLRPERHADVGSVVGLGDDLQVYATLHPAAVLRTQNQMNEWLRDLAAFAQLINPPVDDDEIVLVQTEAQLLSLIEEMKQAETGAMDIETNIGDVFQGEVTLVTMAITLDGKKSWVIGYDHPEAVKVGNPGQWTEFRHAFNRVPWIMHNGAFDQLTLRQLTGGKLNPILKHDTMAMAYLLHEEERKGLEILSSVYLGEPPYKGIEYTKIKEEPMIELAKMNGKDTLRTYRLFRPLADDLNKSPDLSRLYQWLMMPAVRNLIRVTENGVPVDVERMQRMTEEKRKEQAELLSVLQEATPEREGGWPKHKEPHLSQKFNPASPQQVGWVLFDWFGLEPYKLTKTGAPATDAECLTYFLIGASGKTEQWIEKLLAYRAVSKQLSSYLESWPKFIDEKQYMHPRYKPLFVKTGRLSSEMPNIQNVPRTKEFRDVFTAPEGYTWMKADYSQIELRLAAWVSGEPRMLEAYRNGEDLHQLTADLIGIDRQTGKTTNFGLLYGAGWKTLQRVARVDYGVRLTDTQAKRYRKDWFQVYSSLADWHDRQRDEISRTGRAVSALGRVRHLPEAKGFDEALQQAALREGVNHPIQSFASDLLLMALNRLIDPLAEVDAQIVCEVHDEIDILVPQGKEIEVGTLVKETMEDTTWLRRFGIELTVPVLAEIETGPRWGSVEGLKL